MTPRDHLVNFATSGHEPSFQAVVTHYRGLVIHAAKARLRSSEALDEVVQNVFIHLARKAARVGQHPSIPAWLHDVSRNGQKRVRTSLSKVP